MRTDEAAMRLRRRAGLLRLCTAAISAAMIVVAAGCAGGNRSGERPAAHERYLIIEEELRELEERTPLLQAVQRLRPAWLRGRGQTRLQGADDPVVIYINNQRAGGPDVLLRWVASEARELHFLDAITATQRFGTGHTSGAIVVVLR
jgi:hypothetical protein